MEKGCIFGNKELTGCIEVNHVAGKSVNTRLFSKYPLKLIVPQKVAPSVDVVWIYALSYGGGLVSGDSVNIQARVGACSTAVFTTQASTKVYKSKDGLACEQLLKVFIEREGTFVMLPDPVTCFAAAKYKQVQAFYLAPVANLVLVDWCTSGRRERGEVWSFDYYRSTNQIFLEGGAPLLLDSMCLENVSTSTIFERMQPFQVVAMVIIYGPQLQCLRRKLEETIQLLNQTDFTRSRGKAHTNKPGLSISDLLVSCSSFGPSEDGLVVRIVSSATELVYNFLRHHLASLSTLIGVTPYAGK